MGHVCQQDCQLTHLSECWSYRCCWGFPPVMIIIIIMIIIIMIIIKIIIIILHKAGNTWKTHMLLWWSVCSACYVEVKPYTARRPWQEQPLAANQRQHRSWWLFVAICICCLPVFLYETLRVFVLIPMFLPWLYVFACCTTSCCEYTHWHNNRKKKKKKKKPPPSQQAHIPIIHKRKHTHTPTFT